LARNRALNWSCIIGTNITGLIEGIINVESFSYITFFSIICFVYSKSQAFSKLISLGLFILAVILAAAFSLHLIPGFSNKLVIDKINLSIYSSPFLMYLNFDKTMAALVIYCTSDLCISSNSLDKKSIRSIFAYLSLCICIILGFSLLLGYVRYDPKFPDIIWPWIVNNLLFVCVGEEIIFRGLLQVKLKELFKKSAHLSCLHIVLTSIIFGLAHYNGGVKYIILAGICGLFYGRVYDKTNRIICSIFLHFGLNLFHILLFTYPKAASIYTLFY
ncbi:MAG: CPBP family intramembrane glutamic endopeptidase, partial [Janthinobacterium lividum]